MNVRSLLSGVDKKDVILDPFPHVVIRDLLPEEDLAMLMAEFPSDGVILDGQEAGDNKRFDYTVKQMRQKGGVASLWQRFVEAQAGDEFWQDFCRLFGEEVRRRYPELEQQYGPLEQMRRGIRYIDEASADVVLDAHISINTPCLSKPTRVRGAHLDDPRKIYGGLYYLRTPEDNSTGGDLLLYEYRGSKRPFFGQQIKDRYVRPVKTAPYTANTLVFFLNTPESLHGVTPRSVTPHTRKFVNLVAELPAPIFDLKGMQESVWMRRLRTYGGAWLQAGFDNR